MYTFGLKWTHMNRLSIFQAKFQQLVVRKGVRDEDYEEVHSPALCRCCGPLNSRGYVRNGPPRSPSLHPATRVKSLRRRLFTFSCADTHISSNTHTHTHTYGIYESVCPDKCAILIADLTSISPFSFS